MWQWMSMTRLRPERRTRVGPGARASAELGAQRKISAIRGCYPIAGQVYSPRHDANGKLFMLGRCVRGHGIGSLRRPLPLLDLSQGARRAVREFRQREAARVSLATRRSAHRKVSLV